MVFSPLEMRGSRWGEVSSLCDEASPLKLFLWLLNYRCILPSSFLHFPDFHL